jgi:hypothetical protein
MAEKKRGRTAGFQMGAEHRLKIANSNILKCLIQHAEGTREMTSTQVTAGLGLLDRVMPKLATHTLEGGDKPIQVQQIERLIVKPKN